MAEGLAAAGAAHRAQRRRRGPARGCGRRDESAAGHRVSASRFDVTDEAAVDRGLRALDADGVAIDILVNNAGIQFRRPMVELETADWRRVIDTNLTSAFVIGREAARRMIRARPRQDHQHRLADERARARHGRALHGRQGRHQDADARRWRPNGREHGIQANAIGPGYMLTDMNQALIDNPTFDAWVKGRTPARRWGQPDELAGTASTSPPPRPTTSTARSSMSTAA